MLIMNDYWRTSGDAEYQQSVDNWANEKYGEGWRMYCTVWDMEALYDRFILDKLYK